MRSTPALVVAVVDDDSRVLESLRELLESAGFATRLFRSATEFLDSGELGAIDSLITDIRMPIMDGWELERIASALRPDLPIILISGDDVAPQEARFLPTERPRVLLRKPFDGQELLAAIQEPQPSRPR